MSDPEFTIRVLKVFEDAENHTDLTWHAQGNGVIFFADCTDFFFYDEPDYEEITPWNLPLLEVTYTQLKEISPSIAGVLLTNVFAGKVRGRRPQAASYWGVGNCWVRGVTEEQVEKVNALFDSLGPVLTERIP